MKGACEKHFEQILGFLTPKLSKLKNIKRKIIIAFFEIMFQKRKKKKKKGEKNSSN